MSFNLDISTIAVLILLSFIFVTYLFKHFKIGKTYFIITMIKSRRFLPLLDKFTHHKRFLELLSDIGIVLGFGAFGVDYLYGKRFSRLKRSLLFIISVVLLSLLSLALIGPVFFSNPLMKDFTYAFALSFGVMGLAGFVIVSLIVQAYDIIIKLIAGKQACPGVAPVIPGVEIPSVPIVIPIHAWISLLLILIIHEGMHGVLARKAAIKIKSAGLLLLGFLPIGAFVEPDETAMQKAKERDAIRVYSAGPTSNFFTFLAGGLVFLFIGLAVFAPFISPYFEGIKRDSVSAVIVNTVDQNTDVCGDVFPNHAYGILQEGDKIIEINGKKVEIVADFVAESALSPESVIIKYEQSTSGQIFEKEFVKNEIGVIGITLKEEFPNDYHPALANQIFSMLISFFASFFLWFLLLNLLIAAVNFLPVEPFDGGKMAKIIFPAYLSFLNVSDEKKEKIVSRIFIALVLALFILNALPLFLFF